jgi:hypothetical protein
VSLAPASGNLFTPVQVVNGREQPATADVAKTGPQLLRLAPRRKTPGADVLQIFWVPEAF